MSDFLDTKREEISQRLQELKPLVDEYRRLEAAKEALDGVGTQSANARAGSRAMRSADGSGGGRGRPKGSGKRAQQALELVRNQPGITVSDLAESMGIKQNYLYRVMPDLAEQGLVTKSGRGWHIRETPA